MNCGMIATGNHGDFRFAARSTTPTPRSYQRCASGLSRTPAPTMRIRRAEITPLCRVAKGDRQRVEKPVIASQFANWRGNPFPWVLRILRFAQNDTTSSALVQGGSAGQKLPPSAGWQRGIASVSKNRSLRASSQTGVAIRFPGYYGFFALLRMTLPHRHLCKAYPQGRNYPLCRVAEGALYSFG